MPWALAGPAQSGTLMPGARRAPDMAWVGVGGIFGNVEERGISGGPALDVGVSEGRFAAFAHAHRWSIPDEGTGGVAGLGSRVLVVDTDAVRLAAIAGASWAASGRLHFVPSLAAEIRIGERTAVDVTLMPYSLAVQVGERTWADQAPRGRWALPWGREARWTHGGILPLGTVGVTYAIPGGADNRVRVGYPELVSFHHLSQRMFLDVGGVLFGATVGVHGRVGFRFPAGEKPP